MGQPLSQQLEHKHAYVRAALAPYHALQDLQVSPVEPATPPLAYRTRAKLIVSEHAEIGLYARGSHDVVDIPQCRVLSPALMAVVGRLRERLAQESALHGALTGVDARLVFEPGAPEPRVLVTLIGARAAQEPLGALGRWLSEQPAVCGVALRLQVKPAIQLLEGELSHVAGSSVVRDSLRPEGPYHYATFGSFVQAHRGQALAMAEQLARELGRGLESLRGQRVLELFAGSGALGLSLCAQGAHVTMVERYAPALEHAVRAQTEQGLSALRTCAGDAEQVLRDLTRDGERFAAVIVNPPRRGLSPGLRTALAGTAAQRLVYVSCDPATLARDLAHLANCGWAARQLSAFDMIPLSAGVESLVLLEPAAPCPLPVLYEDDQLLVVDKPPHLPTTPDGVHPSSVLTRLQREHACPELSAVHRLDVGTSGVCLFAKRRSDVHALSQRLAAGEKRYMALVRGIARTKGIVRAALREQGKTRPAVSRYTRLVVIGSHCLVRVRPEQGRTHQVRKHMAAIGHPVLGDARYGDGPSNRFFEHRHGLDRCFLHAARIVLPALGGRAELSLEAPLAPDLSAVLASLKQ
jgi:23S rRNA (uracil1939-C5)-methyltransferase